MPETYRVIRHRGCIIFCDLPLRRDPACIDLLLAHVAETAAAGL